jgi:hypothetical protein
MLEIKNMCKNQKYFATEPAETSAPPEERGERLLTLPRDRDGSELRLTRDTYEGNPYL